MPMSRYLTILGSVILAAGLTVWLAAGVFAGADVMNGLPLVAIPALLVLYLAWRRISDRRG